MKHKKRNIVLVVLALFVSLAMQAYPSALAAEAGVGPKTSGKLLSVDGSWTSKFVKDVPPIGDVAINETNFPDANFREFVKQYDTDSEGDPGYGILSQAERDAVTEMNDCWGENIGDLTGIEHFTKLEALDCSHNELASLNLSNNPNLEYLDCSGNNLNTLDLSNNPNLEYLVCSDNSLDSLDVSNNPALIGLVCSDNSLDSLDVSNNPALMGLVCSDNYLESLDVSNNPNLFLMVCSDNYLGSLDVSNNPALQVLVCSDNNLTALDLKGMSVGLVADDQVHLAPLRADYKDGKYEFDFNQIPNVDISKIEVVEHEKNTGALPAGVTYDKATGILTVDPNNQIDAVFYWYNTNGTILPPTPAGASAPVALASSPVSPASGEEEVAMMDVQVYLDYKTFDVIYDPAGGKWPNGSTENLIIPAIAGDTIAISDAPTRTGYKFLYWKGSQYQPGQTYEVPVGGHTFVAVWEKVEPTEPIKPTPKPIKPTPKLPKTGA